MSYQFVRISVAAAAMGAAGLLAGCGASVSGMNCDRMVEQAKEASQGQPYKINGITNVREVSRNDQEARCQGNAAWSDNSSSEVYLRAYREGENVMVSYSDQGFNAVGTAPRGAPAQ